MATSEALATAKEQTGTHVGEVADEVRTQARGLMEQSRDRLGSQAEHEASRAAGGMHRWASELHALAEGRSGEGGQAQQLAQEAATRLDEWAGRIDRDGFRGVMGEMQRFARRRPGAFLLGAGAAGFLAGRMLRNRPSGGDDASLQGPYGAYGYAGEVEGPDGQPRATYGPAAGGTPAWGAATAGSSEGVGSATVFEPDVEDFDADPTLAGSPRVTRTRRAPTASSPTASSSLAPPRGGGY